MTERPLLNRLSPESVARVLWFLIGWAVRNPEKVSPEEWAELRKISANKPRQGARCRIPEIKFKP
jgi:hypothetical protein